MPIYELVDIRKFMRGGGWCAAAFGVEAEVPFIADEGAVDVGWETARSSLLESLQLGVAIALADADELRGAIDEVSALPAESSWEKNIGSKDEEMCYLLVSTSEAANRELVLELLARQGRREWVERAVVPASR